MLCIIQGAVGHPARAAGSARSVPSVRSGSVRGAAELHGHPVHGTPQVCFGVAVHISLHLKQSVVFIDTTAALTAARLLQMLRTETSDAGEQTEALQRIHVFRLFDVFALLDCLYELRGGRLQQASSGGGGGSVKAVIVDSVSAVIAPLLGGKQQQEGLSLMTQVAAALKTMAKDFNMAALVTNYVTRSSSGDVLPGLGASWSHVPRTRILMERLEKSSNQSAVSSATLVKSSRQPCGVRAEVDLQWWSRSEGGGNSGKRKLEETDS
ncbi:uncharacterized protein V6R79_000518 [Siganus canaliculatus]